MSQQELLRKLEQRLTSEYKDTEAVIRAKIAYFTEDFDKDNKLHQKMVKDGVMSRQEYKRWYKDQMFAQKWANKMTTVISEDLTNANVTASKIINNNASAMFIDGATEAVKELQDYDPFEVFDTRQIKNIADENAKHLPESRVQIPKDQKWNEKRIKSSLMQSAVKGESAQQLAGRLLTVVGMNRKSAIRNARTMMTGSHNMGKLELGNEALEMGLDVRKKWIATFDNRTRDSHASMHGEVVDMDEEFSNGLMFPADPDGDPAEVYNCRCTMVITHDPKRGGMSKEEFEQNVAENEAEKEAFKQANKDLNRKQTEAPTETGEKPTGIKATEKQNDKTYYQDETQKTLMDAYDSHRELNGLNATPADAVGKDFFVADYGNIDVKSAEVWSNTLGDLSKQYDTTIKDVRVMTSRELNFKQNAYASTFHNYETDISTVIINPVKFKSYDDMVENVTRAIEKGWATNIPIENANRYIATHEFGHTLFDMTSKLDNKRNWLGADYEKVESVRKSINTVYNQYLSDIGGLEEKMKTAESVFLMSDDATEMARAMANGREYAKQLKNIKISEYSMANADEFMAEAFTHKMLGGGSNKYVDEVMKIIDKNFKKG